MPSGILFFVGAVHEPRLHVTGPWRYGVTHPRFQARAASISPTLFLISSRLEDFVT